MDTTLTTPTTHDRAAPPDRIAWTPLPAARTLPEKARASFARLVARVGTRRFSVHFLALQPEHLIAYAEWNDAIFAPACGNESLRDSGN